VAKKRANTDKDTGDVVQDRTQEIAGNSADLVEDIGDVVRATVDATTELTASCITILGDAFSGFVGRRRDRPSRSRSESDRGLGATTVDVVRDFVDVLQESVESSADAVRRSADRFSDRLDRTERAQRHSRTGHETADTDKTTGSSA
jgi:hypothetical protein